MTCLLHWIGHIAFYNISSRVNNYFYLTFQTQDPINKKFLVKDVKLNNSKMLEMCRTGKCVFNSTLIFCCEVCAKRIERMKLEEELTRELKIFAVVRENLLARPCFSTWSCKFIFSNTELKFIFTPPILTADRNY